METQYPEPGKKKGWSTGAKVLLGCGIGCGVLVLIVIGSCGGFYWWVFQQTEIPESESLVGPDATAMAIVRLDPGNQGMLQLVESFSKKANERKYEDMPPQMRKIFRSFDRGGSVEDFQKLLPLQMVWTASYAGPVEAAPDEGEAREEMGVLKGKDHHVLVISTKFGHFLKLISWIISRAEKSESGPAIIKHRGESIITDEKRQGAGGAHFAIVDNSFVIGGDLDAVKEKIDRLKDREAFFEGSGLLREMFEKLSSDKMIRGIITNDHGEVQRFLEAQNLLMTVDKEKLEPLEVDYSGVEVMGWEADFISSDVLGALLYFDCRDEEAAESLQVTLERLLREGHWKMGRLSELEQRRAGSSLEVELELAGFEERLLEMTQPSRR